MNGNLKLCALALGLLLGRSLQGADEAETQFNFATGLLIKNEYALAAGEFEALLGKFPAFKQADIARYRLGEARQKAGDRAAAQKAFEQLLLDYPASERAPQTHYWLAQLLSAESPAKAAEHYQAIVTRWPANPLAEAAAYGVAETRFKTSEWPAAIAACDLLLKQYPNSKQVPNAIYTRGWAAIRSGDWKLALASFEDLLKRFPETEFKREAQEKIAQSLHKLGRLDEALAAYTGLTAAGGAIGREALIGRATILFERNDKRAAATTFEEAVKQLTDDPRRPVCLLNAGHAWFATNDFAKAAATFSQLLKEHPQHALIPTATYWMGYAQLRMGDATNAAATLVPLITNPVIQKSFGFDLHMLIGEAQLLKKDFAAAAKAYGDAYQFKPDHRLAPDALAGQLAAFEKAGDLAAAEKSAAAFAAAFPAHERCPEMRFWVGEFRFRQKQYETAAAALTAFLEATPKHALAPDAHYKLGWCARTAQQQEAALNHFQIVCREYPQHPLAAEAALRAGQSAEALQKPDVACAAYEQVVALSPASDFAQQAALAQMAIQLGRRDCSNALIRADSFIKQHTSGGLLSFAHLYRAEALAQLGRVEEALAVYQTPALSQGETAADAAFGAAWCLRRLARHEASAAVFEKVAATGNARAAEAAFLAARAREDAKDFANARIAYAKVARDDKQPAAQRDEAAYREANCAWQAKDLDGAAGLFTAIASRQPESQYAVQALYDQAWLLQEQNKAADAEARFKELVKRFPQHALAPDVHFRLGEMAYGRNDFAAAAVAYEAALQTPDLAFADEVLYKLGWTYERLNRPAEALAAFAKLIERKPGSERAQEARYRQARLLQAAGKCAEAIAVLSVVKEGPFAERAALLTAEAWRATGKQREALDTYTRLLQTWPEGACRISAQLGRGHSLRAVGAHQDALEAYAAVIAATSNEEAAQATLGQGYCHFAMQNWAEAAKAFLKVDILYGYDALKAEALQQLALTWEKAGDADKATRYRNERAQRYPEAK
jgi:TolA-binding protein